MSASPAIIDKLETELTYTNLVRDLIITKLKSVLDDGVKLTDMSPAARESFMSAMRELNSTLNSRDSSHINVVKLKMQGERDDDISDVAAIVNAFMHNLKLTTAPMGSQYIDPAKESARLDEEMNKRNLQIKEGELLKNDEVMP
jgi:hypothetical protein